MCYHDRTDTFRLLREDFFLAIILTVQPVPTCNRAARHTESLAVMPTILRSILALRIVPVAVGVQRYRAGFSGGVSVRGL